jgi:NAD(P)H-dependent flavin oxidoreductase YrpB (nitropropane dioxygenase family)
MSRTPSVFVLAAALAVTPFVYGAGKASDRAQKREETQQRARAQAEPQASTAAEASAPATTAAPLPAAAQIPAAAPAPITLEQLLPDMDANPETIETENGVSATVTHLDVVVARIGADGKPVMACVDSKEAARRFSRAPVDKLQTKKAKEQ